MIEHRMQKDNAWHVALTEHLPCGVVRQDQSARSMSDEHCSTLYVGSGQGNNDIPSCTCATKLALPPAPITGHHVTILSLQGTSRLDREIKPVRWLQKVNLPRLPRSCWYAERLGRVALPTQDALAKFVTVMSSLNAKYL